MSEANKKKVNLNQKAEINPKKHEDLETDALKKRVNAIIVENLGLGIEPENINPQSSFVDDLGADSLDTVELVMALEEEFDTEIPDEEAEKIKTVQNVYDYINAHAS